MTLLDVSVTNVALPSIGRATEASAAQLQWIVSGYTLAFGLVPVLAGRLGDDHGRRRMFQVGVASFAATSLLIVAVVTCSACASSVSVCEPPKTRTESADARAGVMSISSSTTRTRRRR